MIMMTLSGVKKSFGDDILFDDVSFHINEGDKIGLIGVNGAGKTTLFKILTGKTQDDGGEIFLHKQAKIGYMQQDTSVSQCKTLWEEIMTVFSRQRELEHQLEAIRFSIEKKDGNLDALVKRQHALQEEYEASDGFVYKSMAKGALLGLGFKESEFFMPFSTLSGGQKTRAMLCKLLLGETNLLLLDEPTNHLDIASTQWLEDYLKNYKGALIVISHDRYFLDKVTNKTFEMENKKLTVYNGNYTRYLELKKENALANEKKYNNMQKEISRIEGIIEQQRRWNREKNIVTAESKQKMVDRLKAELVAPDKEPEAIRFHFSTMQGGGNDVISAQSLEKSFDGKTLFSNVNLDIKKRQRVFLLGPNGCGKTTLLRILMEEFKADGGSFEFGANIHKGYYDQAQAGLHNDKTVIDEVWDVFPKMTQTEIRSALAIFLFRGDDVFKEIRTLSGGEKARVALLKLMLSRANLLLLDEPTNHLDIASKEALEEALNNYEGTLFIVSHDRYFINKLADKIYYLDKSGTTEYNGNYDYFLEKSAIITHAEEVKATFGANSYKEQKQKEAQIRKRQNQIKRLEEQIFAIEEEIAELENMQMAPEIATDYVRLEEIRMEIASKNTNLSLLYEQWEELQK